MKCDYGQFYIWAETTVFMLLHCMMHALYVVAQTWDIVWLLLMNLNIKQCKGASGLDSLVDSKL